MVGFLPYWELGDDDNMLAWDTLTEVAFFGVEAGPDGRLVRSGPGWTGWTSPALSSLRDTAHAKGVRLTLTVTRMAWNASGQTTTKALLGSSTAIARLAGEMRASRGGGPGGCRRGRRRRQTFPTGSEASFVSLVRAVEAALDATRPGLVLTFDATGFATGYRASPTPWRPAAPTPSS